MSLLVVDESASDGDWTPELVTEFRARFTRKENCTHCGGIHARSCPRVKRLVWHPNGTLAEVEFWSSGEWSDENVVWPEDIPAVEDVVEE